MTTLPTNGGFSDQDWDEVFPGGGDYSGTFDALTQQRVDDVTGQRIAEVVAFYADEGDCCGEVDMCCLARLTDGTWASCVAWADTTGWGCQADAQWRVALTRELVTSHGLDRSARERLGLKEEE